MDQPIRKPSNASSFVIAAVVLGALLVPGAAEAQRDRPIYAGFGGGPVVDFDCCAVHGRVGGEFGWHFGRDDRGFVMAVEAWTTFGPDYFSFLGGLRLGGDIEVHGNYHWGILLRPSGLVGAGFRDFSADGRGLLGHFTIQPAFDVRIAFADRAVVFWIRPAAFDITFYWRDRYDRDWYAYGAYMAMGGFDFQF